MAKGGVKPFIFVGDQLQFYLAVKFLINVDLGKGAAINVALGGDFR